MGHDTIQMIDIEKRQFWQTHIDQWQSGNLTQKVYCQQANISYSSFTHWRTRLLSESAQRKPKRFIPVKVTPKIISSKRIKLKLRTGCMVYIPNNMSTEELAKLIRLVEDSSGA